MSDEEFLARWSHRKREARTAVDAPQPTPPAAPSNPTPPVAAEHASAEPVDLSSLPPVESIDAATDITAFLRRGIPLELRQAALRRAWSADPAIRGFVGLAENAWDFNDPNAMPGFGPLDCSEAEVSALVDRIIGGVRQAAESLPNTLAEAEDSALAAPARSIGGPEAIEAIEDDCSSDSSTEEPQPDSAAPQPTIHEQVENEETPVRRRTHGGALPR